MNTEELVEWFASIPVEPAETVKLQFALAIDRAIIDHGLTRKDVAESMRTSPAWVTKVLRGDVNLTIESMAKLCAAVGHDLEIKVAKKKGAATVASTVVSQSDFVSLRYARAHYQSAYEIDLGVSTHDTDYCNDREYADAA